MSACVPGAGPLTLVSRALGGYKTINPAHTTAGCSFTYALTIEQVGGKVPTECQVPCWGRDPSLAQLSA